MDIAEKELELIKKEERELWAFGLEENGKRPEVWLLFRHSALFIFKKEIDIYHFTIRQKVCREIGDN